MKKMAMMLAAFAIAGVAVQADNVAQKNQVVTATSKAAAPAAVKLSADELAFATKLNEQNRAAFNEKFSQEQRQAAMVAAKNGANADEAVQHLITAQTVKAEVGTDAGTTEAVK